MSSGITEGAAAFARFLAANGISHAAAAKALHTNGPTIHSWKHAIKRPRAHHRRAIERWTHGVIPSVLWDTEGERASAEGVIPYVAESGPLPTADAEGARLPTGTDE